MSKGNKRTWKLQDIHAHDGAINCLSIGHRSGKVIATGGDDKKVNLWALGKSYCIMSLKGHTSGVDSVRFNSNEDTVVAGSQSGAVKIWNLEASKILRTLSGHKDNVKALDFHPFGDIVASGSLDTNIKLWDYRRKGCIFTYKGHKGGVNCLRFSPDGKWIASAGDDGCAMLWDMTTGKQIGDFKHPSVTSLTFHPVDFLMATAGTDRTVKFWDLDTFEMISSTDVDSAPIRKVFIHPEGWGAYAACQDYLKVYGWEPAVCYDSVNVGWGKPTDIVVYQNQLIGASIQQSTVQIYMADLTKLKHSGADGIQGEEQSPNPFLNPSRRRSFITKSQLVKRMEVDAGETGREMQGDKKKDGAGDDVVNYHDVFNPRHELPRDSEKRPSLPMSVSEEVSRLKQRQSSPTINTDLKRTNHHNRSLSQQNKQAQLATTTKQQATKQPQQTAKQPQRTTFDASKTKRSQAIQHNRDSPRSKTTTASNFKHNQSCTTTTASDKSFNVFDLTAKLPDLSNLSLVDFKQPLPPSHHIQPFDSFKAIESPDHLPWKESYSLTHSTSFQPPPLNLSLNHFPPTDQADELSDEKSISCISGGHLAIINVFSNRHRNLQDFKSLWMVGNVKMALDRAVGMNDQSVLQDIVNLLLQTPSTWTLDICTCILPVLSSLLFSRYEAYANTSLNAVKFILRTYSSLIKDSLTNVSSIGVDITKEERYNKSKRCYQMLKDIESNIDGRFCPSSCSVPQGVHLREIKLLLAQMD